MPEASRDRSSGTFGKDMKRLAAFLVLLLTASAHADTADSLPEGMTRLGPKMRDVAPVLDLDALWPERHLCVSHT
jgi:hypothetical protein